MSRLLISTLLLMGEDHSLITAMREKYIDHLRQYYYIGSMPEVVSDFIENKDYHRVRDIHGLIREGARAKDFELAIQWHTDCGLIHKVHRVSKPGFPLNAYAELSAFKYL